MVTINNPNALPEATPIANPGNINLDVNADTSTPSATSSGPNPLASSLPGVNTPVTNPGIGSIGTIDPNTGLMTSSSPSSDLQLPSGINSSTGSTSIPGNSTINISPTGQVTSTNPTGLNALGITPVGNDTSTPAATTTNPVTTPTPTPTPTAPPPPPPAVPPVVPPAVSPVVPPTPDTTSQYITVTRIDGNGNPYTVQVDNPAYDAAKAAQDNAQQTFNIGQQNGYQINQPLQYDSNGNIINITPPTGLNPAVNTADQATWYNSDPTAYQAWAKTNGKSDTDIYNTATLAASQKAQQEGQAYLDKISAIASGAFPLTAEQTASLNGLKQAWQATIDAQTNANETYSNQAVTLAALSGRTKYNDANIMGEVQQSIQTGIDRINVFQGLEQKAINDMMAQFKTDDYNDADRLHNAALGLEKDTSDTIDKMYNAATAAKAKLDAQAEQDKQDTYNMITKPIQDISAEAAKNNATPEVLAKISAAKTVDEAIAAAGSSLVTGTGDMADYLQYKRDALSNGFTVKTFADWQKANDQRTQNVEYGKAFAAAAGKAAGDKSVLAANLVYTPVQAVNGISYQVPADLSAYFHVSDNGVKYVDLSEFKGTPTEAYNAVQEASAAGLHVVTDKNNASDLLNIQNAMKNIDSIESSYKGNDAGSAAQRDTYQAAFNKLSQFLQTNPSMSALSVYNDAGLDILKAISGVQGFRGGAAMVQQVQSLLPKPQDSSDVVAQKLNNLRTLITNREEPLVGTPSASEQALQTSADHSKAVDAYVSGSPQGTALYNAFKAQFPNGTKEDFYKLIPQQ